MENKSKVNIYSFLSHRKNSVDFWLQAIVWASATLTALIGLFILVLFIFGLTDFSSFGKNFVPMAEETALAFLIAGIALLLFRSKIKTKLVKYTYISLLVCLGSIALLTLVDYWSSFEWNLSNFIGQKNSLKEGIVVGKMAWPTAVCFLNVCISLLLLPTRFKKFSVYFSFLILITGHIFTIGYLYGVPFQYDGTTIPMALPTSFTFIILSIGLLFAIGKETPPISFFIGNNTRAFLFRNLLPSIFIIISVNNFYDLYIHGNATSSIALKDSLLDISIFIISGYIIFIITKYLGNFIDNNTEAFVDTRNALFVTEEKYRQIFENVQDVFYETMLDGTIIEVSPSIATITKGELNREDLIGKSMLSFYANPKNRDRLIDELRKKGSVNDFEIKLKDQEGKFIYCSISAKIKYSYLGIPERIVGSMRDISERKMIAKQNILSYEIFKLLNNDSNFKDNIHEIIKLIKEDIDFDAVGIRLKDGDDFPYYEQIGFSDEFINKEKSLLLRDIKGLCLDKNGKPSLECTCGIVISGKTNPSNSLFTEGGSAWTNNSLQISEIPSDVDSRLYQRNNCIHSGYHSIAIIPIRANKEIIGTLQLNKRKKDSLSLEMILFYEGICESIGLAITRIQMKEKVHEKDLQFRKLSANISDMLFQFTKKPDGSFYVPISSEGIKNIFGCSPNDVLNDFAPIAKVIHPEDLDRVISDIEISAKSLTFFTCEFRVQIPGKDIQWIFSKSSPEELPDGSITWYGFNTDITELKKTEEALEKNRILLNDTGRIAKVGGWEIDLLNQTLTWTDEVYHIHNVSKDFLPTIEGALDFYTPESKPIITKAVEVAIESGEKFDLELQIITTTGEIRDVQAIGKPLFNENKLLKIMGTFQDITERKKTEKTLIEKDAFSYALFQSNPIATIIVDNEGIILDINQKQKIINANKPKLGNIIYRDYAANHSIDMYSELMQCISTKETKNFPDMKYDNKYLDISIAPMEGGAIITCIDITERKKAEETLTRKINELEDFNNLMVGRENKMVELKKEINELLIQLGKQKKYEIVE